MSLTVTLGPDRELVVSVYEDGTLAAFVHDGRYPPEENPYLSLDARNVDTLVSTLADYGVDVPGEFQRDLWIRSRDARRKRMASLPANHPDRVKAEATIDRIAKHLGLTA